MEKNIREKFTIQHSSRKRNAAAAADAEADGPQGAGPKENILLPIIFPSEISLIINGI